MAHNLPLTEETVMMLAKGTVIASRAGTVTPHKLNSREWAAFEQAKTTGFIVRRSGRCNLDNVWFDWCMVTERPYITVRRKGKWASIRYDLIEGPKELSDNGIRSLRALYQGPVRLYHGLLPGSITGDFQVPGVMVPEVVKQVSELILADWKARGGKDG